MLILLGYYGAGPVDTADTRGVFELEGLALGRLCAFCRWCSPNGVRLPSALLLVFAYQCRLNCLKYIFQNPSKLRLIIRWRFSSKTTFLHSQSLRINTVVVLERQNRTRCCQCLTWWDMTVGGLQFNSTTNISTQGLHSLHSTHNPFYYYFSIF